MKKVVLPVVSLLTVVICAGVLACGGSGNVIIPGSDQGVPQIGQAESWVDIPIYPGAKEAYKIQGNETYDGGIWTTIHGIYNTSAGVNDVAAFYQDKMPANGWEPNNWLDMQFGFMGDFTKKNGESTAVIGISNTDNKTTIITIDKKYLR